MAAAQARQIQAAAEYAYNLADQYAQAEAADRRAALARETLRLAQEDLRIAQVLMDAGRESRLRVLQVQATVTSADAELEAAKVAQADALGKLTALAGSQVPFTSVPASLLDQMVRTRTTAAPDPQETPAVLVAEADRDAAARRVNVERVRAVPDVTASLGFRRFPADNSTALVAGVSAPLPLFDRNRGNIGAARAELEAAEARLNAARLDAQSDVRTAMVRSDAAEARLSGATAAEAAASETYSLTRTGYESGKLALFELLAAQRGLADARTRVVDAQLARVRAEADLARLQGRAPFGG